MKRSTQKRVRRPVSRLTSPVSNAADLLFEIGTEELPAAYLPSLIGQLKEEASRLFQANHLPFQTIESFGTPRRLVLLVHGLSSTQHKPAEEIRGPSKQASYDGAGKPTQALLGFVRSRGGTLSDTKLVSTDKGAYVYLLKQAAATPTAKVLPILLPQLIGKLRSPKTMRWDASGVRFARPIRWLLAFYGSSPVRCSWGTLHSQAATRIGRPQQMRTIRVASINGYLLTLKKAGVMLDQRVRQEHIERMVSQAAKTCRGTIAPEMVTHGLLDEVTCLVEEPTPLTGVFDPKYLALPREVLLASMAKHQRVFAIESKTGLLPRCVAILEGAPKRSAEVRKVIERILNARLADSLMFWEGDHKRLPLERMAQDLAGVTFHEKLGSMADKSARLDTLSAALAEAWKLSREEHNQLTRACRLAKADLVSTMVKEFPTLQGMVGKYYANDSGESAAVAQAIEEHYLPVGEQLPKTLIGSALAILDKYDTLSSYFGLGIMPTGDQDPFGLRRAAQGIVEVAWKRHRPLPLSQLLKIRLTMRPFAGQGAAAEGDIGRRIQRYLFERLYTFAWPAPATDVNRRPGPAPAPYVDCIDAVLASPCDDLIDVMNRIQTLQRLSGDPRLLKAAKVIERTRNILKGANVRQSDVDPARLQEPLEQQLWELYRSNASRVTQLTQEKSYAEATTVFGDLFYEPLHLFFDKVLVNVPDESLQQNRLALMRAINTLYTERVADLSKLTILQQHEEPR